MLFTMILNIVYSVDKIILICHSLENALLIISLITIYRYFSILLILMFIIKMDILMIFVK